MANAAEFLITLNQQVSGPATIATGALGQTELAAKRLTDVLGNASAGAVAAGVRMAGVGDQLRDSAGKFIAAGDAAGQAAAKIKQAQQAADAARGPTRDFGNALQEMGNHAFDLPGPLGKIQDALSKLGPEGQAAAVAIGVATVAITVFTATVIAGMAVAISITETLGRMRVAFDSLAGGAAGGAKVAAMVGRLGQSLPFATSEIAKWSASLLQAGIPATQLEGRLKAIAAATALTALTGGGGGAAAEAMFKRLSVGGAEAEAFLKKISKGGKAADHDLKEMGISLAELGGKAKVAKMKAGELADAIAKALAAKGGKALAAEMNTLPVIFMKAKEGALSLFAGVKTEGFAASVGKLFGLFNKGGFAIQILKPIVTSVFGTIFSWASKALGFAYDGLIRLAIWGVKAYIMLHPLGGAFRELWAAVVKLGVALGIVGGKSSSLSSLAVVGYLISATFQAVIFILRGIVGAISWVVGAAARLVSAVRGGLSGMGGAGKGAGGSLVSGLVQGILGGAGAVAAAIGGLASGALAKFRAVFDMHSPSRVLKRDGRENMAGAVAEGVNDGAPMVKRAIAGLGSSPPGGARGAAGAGKGGDYYDFRGAHFGGDLDEGKVERIFVRILQAARRSMPEMEPAT